MSIDPPDWHKENKGRLERAFQKALEEKQQKENQSSKETTSRGSDMIRNDRPHPVLKPKSLSGMVIDRSTYNKRLADERSKQTDSLKKARAIANDIKKRMPTQKQQSSKSLTGIANTRWQKDMGSASKKVDEASQGKTEIHEKTRLEKRMERLENRNEDRMHNSERSR